MDWNTIVFNDIRLGQIVAWVGGILVVLALIRIYRALFAKRKVNLQHTVYFVCGNCQWEGHISKFGTCCPKCDSPVKGSEL